MRVEPDKEKAHGANPVGFEMNQQGQDSDAQTNAQARETKPSHCPRFDHCSAPICPIDQDWRKRAHLRGEPICLYLRECVKPNARTNLDPHLGAELVATVMQVAPTIMLAQGDIRKRLALASVRGSKLASTQRLKRAGKVGHEQ